jgi:tRNA-dihydrouridine synthase A
LDIKKRINRKVSVAPMMDCTDRHDRFFLRLMSKNVMLYSEMVATKSAIHGERKKILSYSPEEKPLALQVGGSDKNELAEVAKIAEDMGYDEININLGCPSKKVQKNMFGACLMKEPDLVAECINSMVNACKIPVTAKTRIGFDDTEEFDYLNNFIHKMRDAGSKTFILHARKAMLSWFISKTKFKYTKIKL